MLLRRQITALPEADLDLTPMVDVIFQLLTFLLLTYHPASLDSDVPAAHHGVGVNSNDAVVLLIQPARRNDEPVRVSLIDSEEGSRNLTSEELIRQVVVEKLASGRRHVILQAAGIVPHREVLRVALCVSEVEGILLHIGVREAD